MWNETKNGLYRQFVFADYAAAWSFMQQAHEIFTREQHYPRWQNEWNVVEVWLSTQTSKRDITEQDWRIARELDVLAGEGGNEPAAKDVDKKTSEITEVYMYADGGSRGNPGPSASGYVVLDMAENVLAEQGTYLGVTTNNQAEYQALKLGLELALQQFRARTVHVRMDSLLVINQMKGIYKVKNRDLWPVHDAIRKLLPKFDEVTFEHVPRELNKLADAEVNKALDAALGLA